MVNKKYILAIILVTMIAVPLVSLYDIDEAEAQSDSLFMDTGSFSSGGFDTRTPGNVSFEIRNDSGTDASVDVYVTYQNQDNRLTSETVTVPTNKTVAVNLSFEIGSEGTKYLTVWAESDDADFQNGSPEISHNFTIYVGQSIWSNWGTYVAIIAVVIIVAVALYLRSRNVTKEEPELTFTELEELERSKRQSDRKSTAARAPSAERQRYEGRKSKKRR